MRISRYQLRALVESVLLEGFKDDQRWVIEKAPEELVADVERLKPAWIAWIISRFGDSGRDPKLPRENHPFEEALRSVLDFSKAFDGVAAKWKSNETFRNDVDESIPGRAWKGRDVTPEIIPLLTSDEMETLRDLTKREKGSFRINVSEEEMESDRVGKVGPWNLWMPTNRERSCKIAGYDPHTLQPKTTWCTARLAGSNAFYNYVGRPGMDMTLFYIIRDDPRNADDWLSLGFVNGKPDLTGRRGWISVNRENDGLTQEKLRSALGDDFDKILQVLTEKNKSLKGRHPARDKIEAAALSVEGLRYLTKGLSKEDSEDIKLVVVREPDVSSSVLDVLSSDASENVRAEVAKNKRTPHAAFLKLADDRDPSVLIGLARNPSTPPDILDKIAFGTNEMVRYWVAGNKNTSTETLRKLYHTTRPAEAATLRSLAANPNLPEDLIVGMYERGFRTIALKNPSAPLSFLERVLPDADIGERARIAQNRKLSADTLASLGKDTSWEVRANVAENPSTPRATLENMLFDDRVRKYLPNNPSLTAEMLERLASDPDPDVRNGVARHEKTPPEILMNLAHDPNKDVRWSLTINKMVPIAALQKLTKDRSSKNKTAALDALARRQAELNETRLRRLIRQML